MVYTWGSIDPLSPPPNILAWLTKPHCVSEKLRPHCQTLSLSIISWQEEIPLPEENQRLGLPERAAAMVRQVTLQGDGVPWTQGRLVVPLSTYHHAKEKFDTLGNRLLGETLLYPDANITRSGFEFAEIAPAHFARRSVFWMEQHPLLLTEIFLPAIPDYA